ncbi:MAG: TonB family protein [Flavipsychrobacter sp.]
MSYLLQTIIYTGLMLAIYQLILRNKPVHTFNRAYLIASAILPVVLPLLHLPELLHQKVQMTNNVSRVLPAIIAGGATDVSITVQKPEGVNIVWLAYWFVALIGIAVLLHSVARLLYIVQRNRRQKRDGYTIVYNTNIGPGSWGRYVLLPDSEADDTILEHERAHIQLGHTADLLLLNLLQCAMWPNVFLYFIKKELQQVHEFQADAKACRNAEDYSRLLLASVFNTCNLPLTHSFIIHPIKRRIMMLNNNGNKKGRMAMISVAILSVAVILSGTILLQSCNKTEKDMGHTEKITDLSRQPSYPDAVEWNEFIAHNLKYPKEAEKAGKEGRVLVKFTVDKKGYITNPRIVTSNDTVFSAAALKVMQNAPQWIPGEKNGKKVEVDMYQPFLFRLGNEVGNKSTKIIMTDPKRNAGDVETITDGHATKVSSMEIPDEKLEEYRATEKKIQDAQRVVAAKQAEINKAQAHLDAMQAEVDKAAAEAKKAAAEADKAKQKAQQLEGTFKSGDKSQHFVFEY